MLNLLKIKDHTGMITRGQSPCEVVFEIDLRSHGDCPPVRAKWQLSVDYVSQSSEFYEFTKKTLIWHREDGRTGSPPFYYLSNKIPDKFDSKKVGVTTNGCYLNKYLDEKHFTCYAITIFDKSKGKMVLELKNEKFIGPNKPITFIRIDKKK